LSTVIADFVPGRRVAVVRARLLWSELGTKLIPLLDRVYVAVRAGDVVQTGQNVFIYSDRSKDGVTVEAGVEVAAPFGPVGDVEYAETPAGEAAFARHVGPYSELGPTHEAIIEWCAAHGRQRTGVYWEVYGDWVEDASKLETDVFYALR
jgi:effector-binding domain-containing protein